MRQGNRERESLILETGRGNYVPAINRATSTPFRWMLIILLALSNLAFLPVTSKQTAPPGPDRVTAITVNYTAYTWWMATWNKNQVVCSIVVDHDGQPTLGEVYTNCDPTIYYAWENHSWYKLPQESVVHHDPQRWNRR